MDQNSFVALAISLSLLVSIFSHDTKSMDIGKIKAKVLVRSPLPIGYGLMLQL